MCKWRLLVGGMCAISTCVLFGEDDKVTSQTTFIPRSIVTDPTYSFGWLGQRDFLHKHHASHHECSECGDATQSKWVAAKMFVSETQSKFDLAEYFFLNNKTTLNVFSSSATNESGDIYAEWLGFNSGANINSDITIAPKRQVYGTVLSAHFDLDQTVKHTWLDLYVAPMKVTHELKITERRFADLGIDSSVKTVIDALNQSGFLYGHFNKSCMTKVGLDDVLFRLGHDVRRGHNYRYGVYGMLSIPFGQGTKAEDVFEPLVGSNHWGAGFGGIADTELFHKGDSVVSIVLDGRYLYKYRAIEKRSFDLKNGPWTRYLMVAESADPSVTLPGINWFTRDMYVKPGCEANLSCIFRFVLPRVRFDVGYNIWSRAEEEVSLKDPWNSGEERVGIFGSSSNFGTGARISNKPANVARDSSLNLVTSDDLDLRSAAHKMALSHKVHAAMSFDTRVFGYPAIAGLGASYEIASSNTALTQWGAWGNISFTF